MDVIRGTGSARRRLRWWNPRPALRIVDGSPPARTTRDDRFILAMVGSFCLFVLVFAVFIGAWTGG